MSGVVAPRGPLQKRDATLLRQGPVAPKTHTQRQSLVRLFDLWLSTLTGHTLAQLARSDVVTLSELLREFGYRVFEMGWSVRQYSELINGVADCHAHTKKLLSGPWRVVTTWHMLIPSEVHTPMPLAILHAGVALAASWGWWKFAAALLTGFFALLRPGELYCLRRRDLLLPHQHDAGAHVILIRIGNPKVRHRGAAQQYSRLDAPDGFDFLVKFWTSLHPNEQLWPASPGSFARRFGALFSAVTQRRGHFTPASLRTGGATVLFQRWGEDIQRLQWRGRWATTATLPHYIQELQAASIFHHLPAGTMAVIHEAAELMVPVLQFFGRSSCRNSLPAHPDHQQGC